MVDVLELSTGNWLPQMQIPVEYFPHLTWIQQESVGDSTRSKWLSNILDCFVEELQKLPPHVHPSWRSTSLNPLLVRRFNGLADEDVPGITNMVMEINGGGAPTLEDWKDFYIDIDVISLSRWKRWSLIEGIDPTVWQDSVDLAAGGSIAQAISPESLEPGLGIRNFEVSFLTITDLNSQLP